MSISLLAVPGLTPVSDAQEKTALVSIPEFFPLDNGRIGKVHTIRTGVPRTGVACGPQPDMEAPEELDYDAWLGPAPKAPYTLNRVHPRHDLKGRPGWMRRREYCEDLITNWGTHLNDIAQWGNGTERTGPVEVEARGVYPPSLCRFGAGLIVACGRRASVSLAPRCSYIRTPALR
jgi:hypothetical protein